MAFDWGMIKTFADVAIGAYGLYENRKALKDAERLEQEAIAQGASRIELSKDLYNLELAKTREQLATRRDLKEIARRNLQLAESMYDDESARRVTGLMRALLEGAEPKELNVFQPYFRQVDESLMEELRGIDSDYRKAKEQIALNTPPGGVRTRLLAELTTKAMDLKGKAQREALQRKEKLNLSLKNEWLNKAMAFGEMQPSKLASARTSVGSLLAGSPLPDYAGARSSLSGVGPTSSELLADAISKRKDAESSIKGISGLLHDVWGTEQKTNKDEPIINVILGSSSNEPIKSTELIEPKKKEKDYLISDDIINFM